MNSCRLEELEPRLLFAGNLLAPPALLPAVAAPAAPLSVDYAQVPLSFVPNVGPDPTTGDFVARGAGYAAALARDGVTLDLRAGLATAGAGGHGDSSARSQLLHIRLVGSGGSAAPEGLDLQSSRSNYFLGAAPSGWHAQAANYGKIRYGSVYPGIDVVYYGNQRHLEYDFNVAPAADPSLIRLSMEGADGLQVDAQGNLIVHTPMGDLIEQAPVAYQEVDGVRQAVAVGYQIEGANQVTFALGTYDSRLPLTIDPVLAYSTYLGGSGVDQGLAIAVDSAGNIYVVGSTASINFPTQNPLQGTNAGPLTSNDAFISKLNPSGTALVYSTYLGGSGEDFARGVAVDAAGNVYVTGDTSSPDFPTKNALQGSSGGGPQSAFVVKLDASGSMLSYSTYLGGSGGSQGFGIAVDGLGSAYVTGSTAGGFPTMNAVQSQFGGDFDAFVSKLNATGNALIYSTYLGGPGFDLGAGITVDATGSAYVTGMASESFPVSNALQPTYGGMGDAFVTKLSASGTALVYSTYLGGAGGDNGKGIAVDGQGNAYITGFTDSSNFPTVHSLKPPTTGDVDAFVAKLSANGTALVYSTYLGGSAADQGFAIAVDGAGSAYVTGLTQSSDFQTQEPMQNYHGDTDAFVTKLNPSGTALVYSTFLGGSGFEEGFGIAVDAAGDAFVVGVTDGGFPVVNPLQPTIGGHQDAFVAKLSGTLGLIATGPDVGGGPDVRVYNSQTSFLDREVVAYNPAFTGGVRVALGDVTGDGVPDIITAPGPGGGPDIRVFDGVTGQLVREFFAYNPNFTGGVFVAAADLNHDGLAEIVTGPDSSGGPDIRVFDGATGTLIREFFAYNPGFTGGVRVALGDVSGDTTPDIITAPGPTGGPDIRVYDFFQTGFLMREFFAYNPGFIGGVYVSAADLDGDGRADIITSPGAGGGPDVRVYSGATGAMIRELIAYAAGFTGGVRVATVDVNGDGVADIITSPGMTGGPDLRAFDGKTGAQIGEFLAYDTAFLGGVFVGGA